MLYLTPCRPNQIITTDLTGPFKKTARGNTDIQIICDSFTKFTELYAIPDTKAPQVAQNVVDEWSCTNGVPEAVLSDGCKQYQSKLMDLIFEYLDIKKLKTTPFHPQCDGQSERSIQTIKKMIKAYIDEDQNDWDLNLKKFAFAYNTAVHSVTKQTPFEMMFGRRPRIPIDVVFHNSEVQDRFPILREFKIIDDHSEITVLEDYQEIVAKNMPELAKNYLDDLKEKLTKSYEIVS
ncbi:unnamed protein product [Brachionus calyciflorus]|uniref:Integrase catalytic domain-containing protein n=1 Tax=Brachionus calyciflorus TaxID=104777 RepID=A0A814D2Q3_9BILA|nr:unnamed protein product [Brachionus calyciflorus]